MSSNYTTADLAGWEPIEAPAPEAKPLGYACDRGHGSTVTRTVPGICSICRSSLRPVYSRDRLAHLFPARTCFACGQTHRPNSEC